MNADNLLWLANERYRGERLIVWSHNVHAAHTRMSRGVDSLVAADAPGSLESTGRLASLQLGDALYSIGTTAYEGEWGFPAQSRQTVQKPRPGALVELLNQVGHPVAIVNLRDRWYPVVWPEVFDGLLFVQRMTLAELNR